MKFSNFMFTAAENPADDHRIINETLDEARLCDELGMDTLWLGEHHFDGICAYVDPVSYAAALATAHDYRNNQHENRRLEVLRERANTLVYVSAGFGTVAVGTGLGAAFTWPR